MSAIGPQVDEFAGDRSLTLVEYRDAGPDSFGRREFFAYWLADNVGYARNEFGVRGQVFHARPDWFEARSRVNRPGSTIREWRAP